MTNGANTSKVNLSTPGQRLTSEQLQQIPKVDLHRHIEGSLRLSSIKEMAKEIGLAVPADDNLLKQQFQIDRPGKDLTAVLDIFKRLHQVLGTPAVIERVGYEVVVDAFKEGVRILELRYAPTFVLGERKNMNFADIQNAFMRGIRRAEAELPIAVGVILILQRILPVAVAEEVCDFAIANRDTVIGLDLADNEVGFDCRPFAPVFHRAKKAGLRITVHAGEPDVPEAPQSVIDAIEVLGAERIGHGLQIIKDPKALKLVVDRQIPLELCPHSNWLCNAIRSTEEHPFVKLMNAGVPVTINSDDPGFMSSTLVTDYEILAFQHGLDLDAFTKCNATARRVSFISETKKQAVWPTP